MTTTLGLPSVLVALAAVFAGTAVLAATVLGVLTQDRRAVGRVRDRLAPYRVTERPGGSAPADADATVARADPTDGRAGVLGGSAVARGALDLAERVIARRGLEGVLADRLQAADLPLRTAEWFVLHVLTLVGTALLFVLLTGGSTVGATLGVLVGGAGPWALLVIRQGRRERAFLAQLPDTLQLLASSLRAGWSLLQAVDAAARRSPAPMSVELQRALVETRLGVPVEDALERIGDRLRDEDFTWVVMAVRIQREVGGNLAELLLTVADTLRERERLRRQVDVLSAEGRLSGIVLGVLPVGFAAFLMLARPEYLRPMLSPFGLLLVVLAVVLLAVGGIWVSRVVKVEV